MAASCARSPASPGGPSLPTPLGHFKVYARGMWPGGPYGARIMSYHPPCAIHGTNEPHLLSRFPRNFSHGCTRLSNANAIWLYDHAPLGTPVWNVPELSLRRADAGGRALPARVPTSSGC